MMRPYDTRNTNHCRFSISAFSTDTPFLTSQGMEGVQEVVLHLDTMNLAHPINRGD